MVSDPQATVGEVMTRDVVRVQTGTDQEEVARLIQRYDFLALPVVDSEDRLVGIVTVDDVIDVIEQEATRDLYAAGAVQAGDEDDYFQSNFSPWPVAAGWCGSWCCCWPTAAQRR